MTWAFLAAPAGAQTAPAAHPSPPPAWTVAAGFETFWLRDIARATSPVDASPIAWKGEGPAIVGHYHRNHHRIEGSFSSASSFALESPIQHLNASSNDRARRLAGRYEYRWSPFRNVGGSGLDFGIGAEGDAGYLTLLRHFPAALELRTQVVNFGVSAVAAIQWSKKRFDVQAALGNGLTIGRSSTRHLADIETLLNGWGGGWQSRLNLRAAVRVRPRTSVMAGYLYAGEGRFASHDSFTYGGARFSAGVVYER